MLRTFTIHIVSSIAVCLIFMGQPQAIMLGFDSPTNDVSLGSSVDVDLVISGLGDSAPPSLGAFDVDVFYDPLIVTLTALTFGTDLGTSIQSDIAGLGTVNLFEVSLESALTLDAVQPGAFTLATLTFDGTGLGISALNITVNGLIDALASDLPEADVGTGSITVSSVPEPTTLILLSIGLAGLGFTQRGRKS